VRDWPIVGFRSQAPSQAPRFAVKRFIYAGIVLVANVGSTHGVRQIFGVTAFHSNPPDVPGLAGGLVELQRSSIFVQYVLHREQVVYRAD